MSATGASLTAPGAGALPKTATLADLYDPLSMPPALAKAHAELDRAVEKCYRPEPFDSDRQRVEFLFALYEKTHRAAAARHAQDARSAVTDRRSNSAPAQTANARFAGTKAKPTWLKTS